jgi:hypothetical protein
VCVCVCVFLFVCLSVFLCVCFCVCVCLCGGGEVCNVWMFEQDVYCTLTQVFPNLTEIFLTLTEVFPCFFLICKANARVKLVKTGHGRHSSTLIVIMLFYVLFVSKYVLPPGDNPIAVNKCIIYHLIYTCLSDKLS